MENFININGVNIRYNTTGEGDDVLLLHGWGCNIEIWKPIQDGLSKAHRVTAIDFPGFGQSQEPPEVWGVEQYTQCTEQLIEQLQLKKPTLIGHSFGGRVSILLASRNNYVGKVILTDAEHLDRARELFGVDTYTLACIEDVVTATIDEAALASVRTQATDIDPLYANFTSGSTGTPALAMKRMMLICHSRSRTRGSV